MKGIKLLQETLDKQEAENQRDLACAALRRMHTALGIVIFIGIAILAFALRPQASNTKGPHLNQIQTDNYVKIHEEPGDRGFVDQTYRVPRVPRPTSPEVILEQKALQDAARLFAPKTKSFGHCPPVCEQLTEQKTERRSCWPFCEEEQSEIIPVNFAASPGRSPAQPPRKSNHF